MAGVSPPGEFHPARSNALAVIRRASVQLRSTVRQPFVQPFVQPFLQPLMQPAGWHGSNGEPDGRRPFRPAMHRVLRQRLSDWARNSGSAPIALSGVIAFFVVFVQWFTTGAFYATGDITPWVRTGLAADLGWQWTHQLSGAGGPSYEIARAPEVLFNNLAALLGGGEPLGQRLLFSSMWAFAAVGGAAVVGTFARRRWTVVLGGLATAFNAWFLLYLPNYLPVLTIGVIGSLTALAVRAARGERRRPVLFAFALVPVSYISINPPLVLVIGAWVFVLPVVATALTRTGRSGFARVVRLIAVSSLFVIPLSLWWVVPMGVALKQSLGSGSSGAVTDVVAWSWTHRRNSIPNVFTLHSEWSWPMRQYHGAAVGLAKARFAWLDWVLPSGIVLAPIVVERRRRRPFLIFGTLLPVMVLLGKGLHEPLRAMNLKLYRVVPGLWLLREPMSKLGPLFLMAYVVAWAVSVEAIVARARSRRTSQSRSVLRRIPVTRRLAASRGSGPRRRTGVVGALIALLMVIGPAVDAWPMWTGDATSDVQPGRTERVVLPVGWRTVADNVNRSSLRGKALVLPLGDFYQMPTTWGYYGADNLVRQLFKRPVISRNPEGYITDTPTFDLLARSAETAIASGEAGTSLSLLRALGVSHVVVRKDFDLATPQRKLNGVRSFRPIIAGLSAVRELTTVVDTDVAQVFAFTDNRAEPVQLLSGVLSTGKITDEALVPLLTSIPYGEALAEDGHAATVGPAWSSTVGWSEQKLSVKTAGTFEVGRRTRSIPTYTTSFVAASMTRTAFLRLREVASFSLGDDVLSARPDIEIPVPTNQVSAIDVDGHLTDMRTKPAYLPLDSATTVKVLANETSVLGTFGKLQDCNARDARTERQVGLKATVNHLPFQSVGLYASAHSACVSAPVVGAAPNQVLALHVTGRSLIGYPERICLYAFGPDRCVPLPEPTVNGEWATTDALVRLPPDTISARLYLYADASNTSARSTRKDEPRRTITEYRRMKVTRLKVVASKVVTASPPAASVIQLDAGSHVLVTKMNLPHPKLVQWGEVEDCNRWDARSKSEVGIEVEPLEVEGGDPADFTSVVLRARAHAACISTPVADLHVGATYELRLGYRSLQGETPPRVCLLDPSTDQCAPLRPLIGTPHRLEPKTKWTMVRYAVSLAKRTENTNLPRVYIYADTTAGRSELAYTNVTMTPIADESVTVVSTATAAHRLPTFTWKQRGPALYKVSITKASHPFVLALSDSWSPQWKVRGLPRGAKVTQMRIDGYRNGWLIDAKGDLDLSVEYVPARWGRLALNASAIAAEMAVAAAILGTLRRRRARVRSL